MTIYTPGFIGLIVRKNDRTGAFIARQIELFLSHHPDTTEAALNQDDDLIAFSVAMNGQDLQSTIDRLKLEGLIHGEDFVATASSEGVIDAMPSWLTMTLAPTGNPPELEARMEPAVRAMWERSRVKLYHLNPCAGGAAGDA